MLRSERAFNLAVSVVTAIVLSGASAWAITGGASHPGAHTTDSSTSVPCQPGFGHGDTNHCHSGPPKLASTTTSSSTTSSSSTTTTSSTSTTTTTLPSDTSTTTSVPCKPGWGYGDTNHCHSGPPGLKTSTAPSTGTNHKGGKGH